MAPQSDHSDAGSPQANARVGALLKAARRRANLDLDQVSQDLRIRPSQLEALERHRLEDLPGVPYAIGFVRSYAKYLGLDEEETVRRFKEEVHNPPHKGNMVMPEPNTEGRLPGLGLVLLAVALLLLAYGGWYYISHSERSLAEYVPDVPPRLAKLVGLGGDTASNEQTPEPAAQPDRTSTPATEEADATPEGNRADEEETDQETVVLTGEPPAPAPAPETTEEETLEEVLQFEQSLDTADEIAAREAGEDTDTAAMSEEMGAEETGSDETPAPPALPEEDAANAEEETAPEDNAVVLVAESDSWVEVRSANGRPLMARVMNAGEEYEVPDQAGLTLRTGNAGGLRVRLGDTMLPTLGESGSVMGNIALSPDRLRERFNQ